MQRRGRIDLFRRVRGGGHCDSPFTQRHCEPTGRANARPMTGSAKQPTFYRRIGGMDCFVAPLLAMTENYSPGSWLLLSLLYSVIASEAKQSSFIAGRQAWIASSLRSSQ